MRQAIVEHQGIEIQDKAGEITAAMQSAFDFLVERRDRQYSEATAMLDAEIEELRQEHTAIGEKARQHESTLAAAARMAQFDADRLTLEGKAEEAARKIAEMEEAERAPANMQARQTEISARIEEIDREKQNVAARTFESWYAECQQIVRAAEHGLFVGLLENLRESFFEFQSRTNTERMGAPGANTRSLIHSDHIGNLASDATTAEGKIGGEWYRGVRR